MRIRKNSRAHSTKPRNFWVAAVILASLGLALAGEFDAMLAWWMVIALLLPPLLWALKTPYVALKTICYISFLTQFITLPFFYLNRDKFAWGHVKPFEFTAWAAFPMLAKVSLFLFALVIFFRWFYQISLFGGALRKLPTQLPQVSASTGTEHQLQYVSFDVRQNRKSWQFVVLIILLIAVLAPLNLWSFSQGIGITGVAPPALPYRLSGILFYLMKYITPLFLGYLYAKTKRGWLLMLLFLAYAWLLGLCSVSKGAVIIVMLPVVAFAWLDRHKMKLAVASLGTIIGVSFAAEARTYVYTVSLGITGADTSMSIFTLISNVFSNPDSEIWQFDFLPLFISGIMSRFEGFGNLVMSQYYNPDEVVGAWGFILMMIWKGLVSFDTNLHSIQWQGNVLPEGFYNGGALLSNAVIVGNAGLWWVVISAMVAAVILVILEKSTKRLSMSYKVTELMSVALISFLSMTYFLQTGGDKTFVYPFMLLFIASWLPRYPAKTG